MIVVGVCERACAAAAAAAGVSATEQLDGVEAAVERRDFGTALVAGGFVFVMVAWMFVMAAGRATAAVWAANTQPYADQVGAPVVVLQPAGGMRRPAASPVNRKEKIQLPSGSGHQHASKLRLVVQVQTCSRGVWSTVRVVWKCAQVDV